MTRYEAGYLQALKDTRVTARQMVADTDVPEGKIELLAMVSFLTGLIDAKVERHGNHDADEAANENMEEQGA
ncbi:hypothetical protein [Methylobacterium sp. J-068]|uniref:hypothetical protein n=1 Tax=Methylobacterium sp. J-068 TaxID=2836649 RepID=UPI001FB8CFEF|nr:hypothetical protein [Methylobacterium sp. J-068]MCJ2036407.1 hypothetical protein [Methylobacterium sp. J-068]